MREGDVIDERYRVEKKLGQGGMGEVFRGMDTELEKTVAIKVLFPNTPDQVIKRFHTEAKALGALNHPNVMTILHFGQAKSGQLYLVMDYIKGDSLATLIEKRGVQTFFDVLPIFEKICRGLRFAHMNSVLHRDIKPSNVMLADDRTKEDSVKLVDFGLAKMSEKDHHLTKTGSAMGSPPYMSPESVHGKEADERSDIYSLGCTFFEMMVSRPPFMGETQFHTMMAQLNRLAPTLSEISGKEYDEEVEEFIRKCIKKNPDERFQNMDEVIAELERVKNLLTEKRQSSMGILASGVQFTNAFLAKNVKDNRVLQLMGGIGLAIALGVLGIIAWTHFKPIAKLEVKPVGEKDERAMAKAVDTIDFEENAKELATHENQYPKGASIIKDQFSPFGVCNLSGELTDEELLQAVRPHSKLIVFQLQSLKVSNRAYQWLLSSLPIQSLCIRYMDVNDALLNSIGKMPALTNLRIISCSKVPQDIFGRFKKLHLQNLEFDKSGTIHNIGQEISQLRSLKGVQLAGVKLNRSDVGSLSKDLKLGMLNFVACTFSKDALDDLKMSNLCGYFSAADVELTEHQVDMIAEMPGLVAVDMHRTNMSDAWLQKFSDCKKLKQINLAFTKVTAKGAEALKLKVPTLEKVVVDSELSSEEELIRGAPKF